VYQRRISLVTHNIEVLEEIFILVVRIGIWIQSAIGVEVRWYARSESLEVAVEAVDKVGVVDRVAVGVVDRVAVGVVDRV